MIFVYYITVKALNKEINIKCTVISDLQKEAFVIKLNKYFPVR